MQKRLMWVLPFIAAASVQAAERSINFGGYEANKLPPGFRSILAGEGKPGDWQVIEDEASSAMQKLTAEAPVTSKVKVLAQLSREATDERFPILVFDGDTYGDITLTTSFKLVSGAAEQMAGIAFRIQDEKNFYVIRASGLGNNLRFYKVVGGVRSAPIGPDVPVPTGVWHNLKIQCKGNQISCWLDGKETFPTLTDNSFTAGKLGFWTKSDSVAYFGKTELVYTPREPYAQTMVMDMMKQFPRLKGIKLYAPTEASQALSVIASDKPMFLGESATDVEEKTFQKAATFQAKDNSGIVTVLMPLRDRNGEVVAAVHVIMESFPGQTEQNVYARAMPVLKAMQLRVQSAKDLLN